MTGWVKLSHPKTGGRTRVPDSPGVVEHFAERGWEIDDSEDRPEFFIPATDPQPVPEPVAPSRRRAGASSPAVADGAPTEE